MNLPSCLFNELICCPVLCHRGQAEKEFRVEVEAIGHVRHKNLVRLLGYCVEGTHRFASYFGLKLDLLNIASFIMKSRSAHCLTS